MTKSGRIVRKKAAPKTNVDAPQASADDERLEWARLSWLAGNWCELSELANVDLEVRPDRAELALFLAAAQLQLGETEAARDRLKQARRWNCDSNQIKRLLISGVHNSLGRAAELLNQNIRSDGHFTAAAEIGLGDRPIRPLTSLRAREQRDQLVKARVEWEAGRLAKRGEDLFRCGSWKAAAEAFRGAVDKMPDVALYHQWLAETDARLGRWESAVHGYREALKRDDAVGINFYRDLPVRTAEPGRGFVESPIFIVGCGHSGTSIMLAILGNHPEIHPIQKESNLFLKTDETALEMMAEWDGLAAEAGKSRWIEKTPPNIFQIARFLKMRPAARFILMLRDGRDVVCSLRYRVGYANFSDRLDRWIYDNLAGMPFWDHPQVMIVRYEDLVTEPHPTLQAICTFLGVTYDAAMLNYSADEHLWYSEAVEKPAHIITHADHMKNRNWQINQPLFDGRGRWKEEMSQHELAIFNRTAPQALLQPYQAISPRRKPA